MTRLAETDDIAGGDKGLIQLERELERLRADLTEVKASEERFKQSLEMSPMALCHHDRELRYTWIYHPHMGFKPEDVLGKTDWDILEQELADRMGAIKRRVLETGIGERVEVPTRLNDPTAEVFDLMVQPLHDSTGAIVGLSCAGVNITELKSSMRALSDSEQRLRGVQKAANLGYYVYDFKADVWESSDVLDLIFGIDLDYPRDASTWLGLIAPDMQMEMAAYLESISRSGSQFNHEYPIVRPRDGQRRWMLGLGEIQRDEDGMPLRMLGTIQDITDRKTIENNVRRLSRLYKARSVIDQAIVRLDDQAQLFPLACRCSVEHGGMMLAFICQHDPVSLDFHMVARFGRESDYADQIKLSSRADIPSGQGPVGIAFRANHPVIINDYLASLTTAPWHKFAIERGWQSAASFPILRGGKPYAILSVYDAGLNAFDSETIILLEELTQNIAFALDNFDREQQRKQAEEALRLAALVYETSSEAMMVTDPKGVIQTINGAFSAITGYSEQEIVGQSIGVLSSGHHDETFYTKMWTDLNATGRWQGEIWNRRKNGEIYPQWMSINSITGRDGKVSRRVALFYDISDQKKSQEIIWHQANFDALTGLPNRRMFRDRLEQEMKKSVRNALPLALIFIDLDRFKEVNDTLGHEKGDKLLQEVAHRLKSCVRESDTVGRLGGDEFTILLGELDDMGSIDRIAEVLLEKVSAPYRLDPDLAYVSASIGITVYPDDAKDIDGLMKNADQAMYESKNLGRNRFNYFKPAMQQAALNRVHLANDLRVAVAEGQFVLHYQPIIDLAAGVINKAEALIRWNHPKHGLVGPADFISIAEDTGLIVDIGEWVFRQAAVQAAHWRALFKGTIQISINKSPIQFRENVSRHQEWLDHLRGLGLKGDSIVVEITEGLLLDANATINNELLQYKDSGIQVSLDDFGTGYSSLSYLKKFDIDYLKIDQSFVRGLAPGSNDLALCEAIIVMAHKLGMKVIAEGIETTEQRDLLHSAHCDYGQGYLFSKPVPADQFEALLVANRSANDHKI